MDMFQRRRNYIRMQAERKKDLKDLAHLAGDLTDQISSLERKELYHDWYVGRGLNDRSSADDHIARKIDRPPFWFLMKISEALPKIAADNLAQNISDMRTEHNDALLEGNKWRARIVMVNYSIGLIWSALLWISGRVKEIVRVSPK
jgi:hypothetical protein